MILLSHPTGNANVRGVAGALNAAGLLSEFWTSISWDRTHALNRLLPRFVSKELGRRSFPEIGGGQLHCYPWREIARLAARELKFAGPIRHEHGPFSVDAVWRSVDSRVARRLFDTPQIRGVYAYEDAAWKSFQAATELGIKTIYELPIGYWKSYRELMSEEASLQPEWAATLQGMADSDEKLHRKDEELGLASDIIVPSEFVRNTLSKAGQLRGRVTIVPYGAPPPNVAQRARQTEKSKLKVLFVGALSQRKGLSYLLEAVKQMRSGVELTLVGRKVAPCQAVEKALGDHNWVPSVPHDVLLSLMAAHDVMIFPSLFEGFALVILEAMAQGVPVIATANAGATEVISDGEDGFIVPIRDTQAIVDKLDVLVRDRERLGAMRRAAVRKASLHSWQRYREAIVCTVQQALSSGKGASSEAVPAFYAAEMGPAC